MSHELICEWLKLPAGNWPPDHYTLLGLPQGDVSVERIEEQVHIRLELVRRYQLTHAEQATEAMNLLARAFVCLTDPAAKKAYDADLLGASAASPEGEACEDEPEAPLELVAPTPAPVSESASPSAPRTPADWPAPHVPQRPPALTEIPVPVPRGAPAARTLEGLAPRPVPTTAAADSSPAVSLPVPDKPAPRPPAVTIPEASRPAAAAAPPSQGGQDRADHAAEIASSSPAARRGLGTKRALYRRLARTRELARAWEQAGKYLAWPKRRLTRPAEAAELVDVLTTIRTQLRGFPRLLGEAGQPGYLIVALARQQGIVPTFQTLLASQREAYARDWWAGRTLLASHREFLRQELRSLRRRSLLGRYARAVRVFIAEQPGGLLVLLALLALNVAIWRTIVLPEWLEHITAPVPETAPTERQP
jgi:hypothetical protein